MEIDRANCTSTKAAPGIIPSATSLYLGAYNTATCCSGIWHSKLKLQEKDKASCMSKNTAAGMTWVASKILKQGRLHNSSTRTVLQRFDIAKVAMELSCIAAGDRKKSRPGASLMQHQV